MANTEHRDVYIAAAVGGVGLVLVLLYLWDQPAAATNASGEALPSLVSTPPPGGTPYTYNIAPFDPTPGLPGARNINTINAPGGAGGCCDQCGPRTGNAAFNNTVAQFMTLLGYGNAGGAG